MRRNRTTLALTLLALAFTTSVRGEDPTNARAVIDRAIKAVGGEENLTKYKGLTWKEKGTYYGMGAGLPYTAKCAIQYPSQARMEIEGVFSLVLNGDKGWVKEGDTTKDMSKEQLEQQKENNFMGWVSMLIPLKDPAFKLTLLPESKVDDKPAVGVEVAHQGHRNIKLFFDKDMGLLVKAEHRVKAEEQGWKEVNEEAWYKDYQEKDGIQLPMKMTIHRDGKLFVEAQITEIKPVTKLEDAVFAKP